MDGMKSGHLLVLMRDVSWFVCLDEVECRPSEVTARVIMNLCSSFGMVKAFVSEGEIHLGENYADTSDRLG